MAATTGQGRGFSLFIVGATATAFGIANSTTGVGKVVLAVGLIAVIASFFMFKKLKPLEGRVALGAQPAVSKLLGLILALGGWVVVLGGLYVTSSVGGRLVGCLVGLAISLFGILYILPIASNKNAIWKV